jgi:protein-S-isoprenylcysteine O-methyltransferase Ste14
MRRFAAWLLVLNALVSLSGLAGDPPGVPVTLLALVAAAGFAAALVVLIRTPVSRQALSSFLWLGVAASMALFVMAPGPQSYVGAPVDVVLVWGLVRGHWTAAARPALADAATPINPLLYVPVPWVYLGAYLAGAGLQRLWPVTPVGSGVRFAVWLLGLALVVVGGALAAWCLRLFQRARTTTVPLERSSTVVTSGPYRFSRNPMYVSLTLIYVGEAAIFGQLWPLVLLIPTLAYVNGVVIPFEEAQLHAAFGAPYTAYAARVRRWV